MIETFKFNELPQPIREAVETVINHVTRVPDFAIAINGDNDVELLESGLLGGGVIHHTADQGGVGDLQAELRGPGRFDIAETCANAATGKALVAIDVDLVIAVHDDEAARKGEHTGHDGERTEHGQFSVD